MAQCAHPKSQNLISSIVLLIILQATQKQLAHEKILRQQKEREVQSNLDLLDRQGQEMDLLKALLAKLQKYERDLDQKHIPTEQNKQNKEVYMFRIYILTYF